MPNDFVFEIRYTLINFENYRNSSKHEHKTIKIFRNYFQTTIVYKLPIVLDYNYVIHH